VRRTRDLADGQKSLATFPSTLWQELLGVPVATLKLKNVPSDACWEPILRWAQ
jgi:hypothetical protein